jgi:hypothetical protein
MRPAATTWDSSGMGMILFAAEETSWYDVPGVRLLGVVLGGLLLIAAIRSMFGKGGR